MKPAINKANGNKWREKLAQNINKAREDLQLLVKNCSLGGLNALHDRNLRNFIRHSRKLLLRALLPVTWKLSMNTLGSRILYSLSKRTGARFSKTPKTFWARKTIAKSQTLRLQSCFIHIHVLLISAEVPFIQEVSNKYTSPFLDTDKLKMALRVRKVAGAFEKRVPVVRCE